MVKKAWLFGVLLLSSCYVPVFDLNTSLAVLTVGKMESQGSFGPFDMNRSMTNPRGYFFADRVANPQEGYLAVVDDTGLVLVQYLSKQGGGLTTGTVYEFDALQKGYLPSFLEKKDSGGTYVNLLMVLPQINTANDFFDGYDNNATTLFGAGTVPSAAYFSNSTNTLYLLAYNGTAIADYTSTLTIGSSPFSVGTPTVLSGTTPFSQTAYGSMATDGTTFYLSTLSGGSFHTVSWALGSSSAQSTGFRGEVRTILSNGQLVFEGEGWTRVYNPNGTEVSAFPSGSARFVQEYQDASNSNMYCLFSLVSFLNKGHSVTVDLFRVPTNQLSSLNF